MRHTVVFAGLILLIVALGLGGSIWRSTQQERSSTMVHGQTPIEIRMEWRQQVQQIIEAYERDEDITKARDALLTLTVMSEDRETHLAFVLALEARRQRQPDADARWQQAMTKFQQTLL